MMSVVDPEETYSVDFRCGSNLYYAAKLYCYSTSLHFYKMNEAFFVRTKDNGGKLVKITINYLSPFDDIEDNSLVNKILCKFVPILGVDNYRVIDAYGGVCGRPSPYMR